MIHREIDAKPDDFNVVLIDYGLATEYRNDAGQHLPCDEVATFNGNLIFASEHALSFSRPSRRDDLLSLCYILIYLLNDCDFPLIGDYFSDPSMSYTIKEVR